MRIVSGIASLVVFVTTYALVLPAITMESMASCGIKEHQHDDTCYENHLVCNIPESDGHEHTETCYTTVRDLICGIEEHRHDPDCYDEQGNLVCGQAEHIHNEACYEETVELTCDIPEAEGHHHDSSCYERVLACGKEAHAHSAACYRENAASGASTEEAAVAVGTDPSTSSTSSTTASSSTATETEDAYVPPLEELEFHQVLNSNTGIYYHHVEEGESVEDSAQITDWQKIEKDTILGEEDLLRVYLAYTIPAGSLNETNPIARYRLPENLHLTDARIEAINHAENGISSLYMDYDTLRITDPDLHDACLGAEAVEGTRTPDRDIEEYLRGLQDSGTESVGENKDHIDDGARSDNVDNKLEQEYISATVKAENIYDTDRLDGEKDACLGTDLIFTFSPYTIQKNRHEYDAEGSPTKAGEEVTGWFTLDFNLNQVDWQEEKAEIIFVPRDKENNVKEISCTLQKEMPGDGNADADAASEADEIGGDTAEAPDANSVGGDTAEAPDAADSTEKTVTEETYPAAGFEEHITVPGGRLASDTEVSIVPDSEDLIVTVSADSCTFPAGTTMKLSAAPDLEAVAKAVEKSVDTKTCGFQAVDISFFDAEGREIEPLKPIRVSMRNETIKTATEDPSMAPVVMHIEEQKTEATETTETGKDVETAETTATGKDVETAETIATGKGAETTETEETGKDAEAAETEKNAEDAEAAETAKTDKADKSDFSNTATVIESNSGSIEKTPDDRETADDEDLSTAITFEAESFSVYAIVYTVDFHYEVNGKTYEFSLPGGGFISLEHLVEVLGIAAEDSDKEKGAEAAESETEASENRPEASENETANIGNGPETSENEATNTGNGPDASGKGAATTESGPETSKSGTVVIDTEEDPGSTTYEEAININKLQVSEAAKKFVADVESAEFSSPDLVWVGKADSAATVGELKKVNGLEAEYSGNLTEDQIEEINAQTVEAGDWALISMRPFLSKESLTVTMKNGDRFVVQVTDAQDPSVFLNKEVVIYDDAEQEAMTSNLATGYDRTQLDSLPLSEADGNESAHWKIEQAYGGYYIRSKDGRYLKLSGTGNNDIGLVNNWQQATVFYIQPGNNPDYRISAANNYNAVLTYSPNDVYPGYFSAPGGAYEAENVTRRWLYIREVQAVPDRVGDWLLYFDDDFSEITVHVGETITLRPYNKWEWKEGNVDVQTAHWNVGTWNEWNISSSDENGSKLSKTTSGPFEFTRYVKYDDQLETHYWSVQGRATQTGDFTLTNTKDPGKTITVHVVDGAPVNQPKTISKIANIKVNLFDYDKTGMLDGSWNNETQWWNDDNHANDSGYKSDSINKDSGSDHFYFLSSGGGNKDGESWNDYTHASAKPNIVQNQLDSEGYPILNHGNHTSLKYLFDTSQASQTWHGGNNSDGMIAYPNVVGMFQKDPETGYYYFNSNTNYFYYDTATGKSKLYEHTYTQTSGESKGALMNDKPIGFFPFHDYDSTSNLSVNQNHNLNHHVGMSMEVEFMLPNNRLDDNDQPIIFDFSGDDDLWVFVEWEDDQGQKHSKLMLDLGGVHQPIHGQINFTNDHSIESHKPYTLKVFYLERGGCDSNCSIRFNLPIIQDLTVAKKLTGLTEAEKVKYREEEFTYEIVVNGQPYIGPNGPEMIVIRNAAGEDITPQNFRITNGQVRIKDGQTITISYLDRSDKFSVAEVKTPNMENFEVPNAERYYHLEHDASLYEEEIHLSASQTQAAPHTDDWVTPTYELEDTEKVTFTNTLKEKNLEVEKKWKGEKDPPDSITFTVSATVEDGNGGRRAYAVSALKNPDGTDKVFTLRDSDNWRCEIEHLPVNTPEGKLIFYDIREGQVEGYTLTGLKDITAENYNFCNVDVVKLWPDSNEEHTEVIEAVLRNSAGKYYAGVGADGKAQFVDEVSGAEACSLTKENNYTYRFDRLPAGTYTAEQLHEDVHTKGLATYVRNIIQYELENSPTEGPVGPDDNPNAPEIHKRIDALRDGVENPDSPHTGEDLTDLYRLYLDYKIKSLHEAAGVDLLFVIDHSGSMNNSLWQGNPYRAPAVEAALNGDDGLISEFLEMNEKNRWAAVGFKGPDGAEDYYWDFGNPWEPATAYSRYNAGQNGSEVLSPGGENYVFTRSDASPNKNVTLDNEGADILTNYTAGLWRAEQFLLKNDVKEDGRKKVIVFISDGIPTLHIDCPNGTLQGAGTAPGSWYYRDGYGGCPNQTLTEFGYFVNDMTRNGYAFGENLEFYTIGFGGTMQTETGAQLLNGMLDRAYGEDGHSGHYMTISDTYYNPWSLFPIDVDYSTAANTLKDDLRTIMGMNESFSNIVIQDDLSAYVDLYGLTNAGTNVADIMRAAKAKVTMKVPDPDDPDETLIITLYENGAPAAGEDAKFTREDGTTRATIIQKLEYDAETKTVKAVFDPEYRAVEGVVYTLSFDVKATDYAYVEYAEHGYDQYTSGEKEGQVIIGDPDTDFLGTTPDNATSVDKAGFRSNDGAKATYIHNDKPEEEEYTHPVIQVAAKVDIVKIDELGAALEGAKFNLYDSRYDADKTIEENAAYLIEADLQSNKPVDPAGEDAVIRSGKLAEGVYYLVETKSPGGYNALPGPVKITVTDTDGILTVTAETAGVPAGADKLVKVNRGLWKLSVQNTAGYELPSTGGPGTRPFYLIGFLLTVLAGSALAGKRNGRTAA